MDLISELKRKQQKEPLIYESDRDGTIEDIITGEGLRACVILHLPFYAVLHPSPTWGSGCLAASLLLFLSFSFSLSLPTPPS